MLVQEPCVTSVAGTTDVTHRSRTTADGIDESGDWPGSMVT